MTWTDTTGHHASSPGSIESLAGLGRTRPASGSPLNVPPWPASNFVLGQHLPGRPACALGGSAFSLLRPIGFHLCRLSSLLRRCPNDLLSGFRRNCAGDRFGWTATSFGGSTKSF